MYYDILDKKKLNILPFLKSFKVKEFLIIKVKNLYL